MGVTAKAATAAAALKGGVGDEEGREKKMLAMLCGLTNNGEGCVSCGS